MADDVIAAAAHARAHPGESLAAAAAREDTVTMVIPRAVRLTLADHSMIEFGAGLPAGAFPAEVPVPASLAEHAYMKLHDARVKA